MVFSGKVQVKNSTSIFALYLKRFWFETNRISQAIQWIPMWLSFCERKRQPLPRVRGSPEGTFPHRTPERSCCPATGSPRQVNIYPSAQPLSPPLEPPAPGNTRTKRVWEERRNSDVTEIVHLISGTSDYSQDFIQNTHYMPAVSDAGGGNPIPSHQNIIKSPRLRWGTGHRWWRSRGRWDWATTSVGRWGFPSAATLLHTSLWLGPRPSGASLCRL